jgi:GT2 family glycosyltransferase
VDNGPGTGARVARDAAASWPAALGRVEVLAGHGNIGYGRANNLVLERLDSDLHLVMNPDVELDAGALGACIASLAAHPEAGAVAPAVFGADGERQFLCKRYPSLWVLFLRGFVPGVLRRPFAASLERYEMRDVIGDRFVADVPLASGCFLLTRTALLRKVGGFDPGYFLYFEDFDLSVRLGRLAGVAYEPAARIVHHGGHAARKGLAHIGWFVASAWRFFNAHGWRITPS